MGGFNGTGTYVRYHNWTADAANGVDINAGEMDQEDTGFATGLSNCVTRDGQGKMATDFLPSVANSYNLGTAAVPWASINSIPVGQIPRWPQTAAEAAASVTPSIYYYPPGDIRRYNADATGTADSTAAIQAALNSNTAVFVPAGTFKFSALVMPVTNFFVLYGIGPASELIQTGTGISWPSQSNVGYHNQTIHDLGFNCVSGTGHTINTQYEGGGTLRNLYFTDVPIGFDNIHLEGNVANAVYMHDWRCNGIQMYFGSSVGVGHAGIGCGAYCSDSYITDWIMNASNSTYGADYCIYYADGAQSVFVANSHPYNALINVAGSATSGVNAAYGMSFVNCTIDTSYTGDLVSVTNWSCPIFTATWFEGVVSGKNAATLANCRSAVFSACRFDGSAGAQYLVNETGTTDYTDVLGGDSPSVGNFLNPPFNLIGAHSVVKNFIAYNVFGEQISFVGSTVNSIAPGSTVYLGVNGAQSAINSTGFMVPLVSGVNVLQANIAFDSAPGSGTYTFTLIGNGATLTAASGSSNPLVVTGNVFSGTIKIAQGSPAFLAQFNQIEIKMVSSAGAGTPNVRYAIQVIG